MPPVDRLSGARAFTLVELIVVVAILILLAGLGSGNYMDALARARTARVKSEFRTLAGAIEAYTVDHNRPPRMAHWRFYRDEAFDRYGDVPVNGVSSKCLTTPVAYIGRSPMPDPFMLAVSAAPMDERFYTYHDMTEYVLRVPESSFWPRAREFYGEWRLMSVGPDLRFDHLFANSAQLPYDPTNGLFSAGNIIRGAIYDGTTCPPVPELLGSH
ncbi:MAG: type II secretion system GspH family protein [Candidatus Sumerlaeaceae bacterium]|nr:type II secretion system GspH family protein [Candidatus Sumerlaeaceae bacterium]